MRIENAKFARAAVTAAMVVFAAAAHADRDRGRQHDGHDGRGHAGEHDTRKGSDAVQLGVRPFYLVDGMDEGELKRRLKQCENGPFYRTDFSIGHRGATLQFPEHTRESYQAGARQGAGIVECDVSFTKDGALVCRHSECDLHTTTDIVATPLNNACSVPWAPGVAPKCCTSDITLAEYRTLTGKMDASNPAATTPEGYLGGTASWRTDLYTGRGTLLTMRESIRLNQSMGVKHTPELKGGDAGRINAVFGSQDAYAQAFADELERARVAPRDVWPQSFNVDDVKYWIKNTRYGKQAVFLVDYSGRNGEDVVVLVGSTQGGNVALSTLEAQRAYFAELRKHGVNIIAPPMPALLAVEGDRVVPSRFARMLKRQGYDIITWTFERADLRQGASKAGYYYDFDPTGAAIRKDSDMYEALDVLAKKVGVLGIFSDWPATVTYYANCMGLK